MSQDRSYATSLPEQLRALFNAAADACDGDYSAKFIAGVTAIYEHGRATPLSAALCSEPLTDEEIAAAWNGASKDRPEDDMWKMYLHYMRAVAEAQRKKCLSKSSTRESVIDGLIQGAKQQEDAHEGIAKTQWHLFGEWLRFQRSPVSATKATS